MWIRHGMERVSLQRTGDGMASTGLPDLNPVTVHPVRRVSCTFFPRLLLSPALSLRRGHSHHKSHRTSASLHTGKETFLSN